MQPLARLRHYLPRLDDPEHYIFSSGDLRSLFPEQSDSAYRALMSRAVKTGVVERVCRGVFINPYAAYERGYELFHTAARLRADHLTYISLETASGCDRYGTRV